MSFKPVFKIFFTVNILGVRFLLTHPVHAYICHSFQIIRVGLFNQISLEQCPGLANLLAGGEQLDHLMKLSPEAILLRYQINKNLS